MNGDINGQDREEQGNASIYIKVNNSQRKTEFLKEIVKNIRSDDDYLITS